MGDDPKDAINKPTDQDQDEASASQQSSIPAQPPSSHRSSSRGRGTQRPSYSSVGSAQQRPDASRLPSSSQHVGGPASYHGPSSSDGGPFNMASMAGAMPEYNSPPPGQAFHHSTQQQHQHQQVQHRPIASAPAPAVVYQLQQGLQYPPGAAPYPVPVQYVGYGPGQPQYVAPFVGSPGAAPSGYASFVPGMQRAVATGVYPQTNAQYAQTAMPYYYYSDQYGRPSGSPTAYSPQAGQFPGNFRPPGGGGVTGLGPPQTVDGSGGRRSSGSAGYGAAFGPADGVLAPGTQDQLHGQTVPRGPPRKPKQSGHALWVGNLPPAASIIDLKDHFSRDASEDIESLFLISKSNCAFVNYRSEASCAAAMQRFHDSRFQGVRLVCRLRRGSTPASGGASGPSTSSARRPSQGSAAISSVIDEAEETGDPDKVSDSVPEAEPSSPVKSSERYFIVKSLTLQDLEQSVRSGVWATQSHNENTLNEAYEVADNVYLIFSANKSGEYFGYARMASPISENAAEIFGIIPRTEAAEPVDGPTFISTPATEFAPKGRIIDDSARGTIFWEAELTDAEEEEELKKADDASESADAEPLTWGKPFKIEWISTNRLPFYRTRGLRNPWNANREVKIARDGTELEPGIGRRLTQLFHRAGGPSGQSSTSGLGQSTSPSADQRRQFS